MNPTSLESVNNLDDLRACAFDCLLAYFDTKLAEIEKKIVAFDCPAPARYNAVTRDELEAIMALTTLNARRAQLFLLQQASRSLLNGIARSGPVVTHEGIRDFMAVMLTEF